jgi:PRD1 phage membrane DNA delivery
MNSATESIVTIASGIIAVAIVAVLVSNRAQTGNVLGAAGSAFANALSAATAPVTGNAATPNVSGPSSFGSSLMGGGILTGNLLG